MVVQWLVAKVGFLLGGACCRQAAWWMPLTLAPAWAAEHPDETPSRPAFDVLRELINWLQQTSAN
jgi:hypothetical protein